MRRRALVAVGALLVLAVVASLVVHRAVGARDERGSAPGAAGIGDDYFPGYGNGGYDVSHYDLRLSYDPRTGHLAGQAVVTATAGTPLTSFDLDLSGLSVSAVTVDGTPARYRADGDRELVITPARAIPARHPFAVDVRYAGTPQTYTDQNVLSGFLRNGNGAVAAGEPQSATSWFPSNDHPRDKATFDFAVTVPDGWTVVCNGLPGPSTGAGGRTTYRWRESAPMATYLATIAVGHFRVSRPAMPGTPVYVAVADSLPATVDRIVDRTPEILGFLSGVFGPYPFDSAGAIVPDEPRLHFALETQTRPIYPGRSFVDRDAASATALLAHELTHQWYGDSVSLHDWRDIWLNEGFATYGQWLWSEHLGGRTVREVFDDQYARPESDPLWSSPPGAPGPAALFGSAVYQRGGMTLVALRLTVGDATFGRILREWAAEHRGGNATTADFVALASRLAGRDLRSFFQDWLYRPGKPPSPQP